MYDDSQTLQKTNSVNRIGVNSNKMWRRMVHKIRSSNNRFETTESNVIALQSNVVHLDDIISWQLIPWFLRQPEFFTYKFAWVIFPFINSPILILINY